ncbi:hypothetical protein [Mycetohabitans rhizoxinica]|uniref:Uncharacterized protein n=1 Tax=Mycetohabitans rhizoxinica TaxID=412963 RepID=A0ABZ2PW52_9BURK
MNQQQALLPSKIWNGHLFDGQWRAGSATAAGVAPASGAEWEAFTQWQWLTVKGQAPAYPL